MYNGCRTDYRGANPLIRAVLFDLDGTLLDRDNSVKRFVAMQHQRWQHCLGHIPQADFITRFVELDARGYVWKDKVYRQLLAEFGVEDVTWEALLEDYVTLFHQACVPFAGLAPVLDELSRRNLKLGMITNGYTALQMSNIQALGIEAHFTAILVSEQEGLRKPDPQIFMTAMERLGVTPEESIYVGDHPLNDVQASRGTGMTGVWKRDDYWLSDTPVQADFVIDELPLTGAVKVGSNPVFGIEKMTTAQGVKMVGFSLANGQSITVPI